MQGRIKTATQSRYARMHKDSHTKPLHDATAQMAVYAQMWQPKRLTRHDAKPTEQARRAWMHDSGRTKSLQGRSDPNDRISTPRRTSTITNRHSPVFWCWEANSHSAGKARMPTSNNLYNFLSNVLTNYNNILQNPFKFVILYQKGQKKKAEGSKQHKQSGCRF